MIAFGEMEHIGHRCGGLPVDVARSLDAFKRQTKMGSGGKMDGGERWRKAVREIKYYRRVGYICIDVGNKV